MPTPTPYTVNLAAESQPVGIGPGLSDGSSFFKPERVHTMPYHANANINAKNTDLSHRLLPGLAQGGVATSPFTPLWVYAARPLRPFFLLLLFTPLWPFLALFPLVTATVNISWSAN